MQILHKWPISDEINEVFIYLSQKKMLLNWMFLRNIKTVVPNSILNSNSIFFDKSKDKNSNELIYYLCCRLIFFFIDSEFVVFSCSQNVAFKLLKIAPTFETRGFQRLQPISQLASLQSKNVTQVCIFTSQIPKMVHFLKQVFNF